jgi:hypothetical protein
MGKRNGGASMLADGNFAVIGETRTDSKKRVVLRGDISKHYMAYVNDAGQILLDPIEMIPTRSIKSLDAKTLASIRRGIKQAKEGKIVKMPSLAKHS